MSIDIAAALRRRCKGRVATDEPLGPMTTFRVGGAADVFVEAESLDDLRALGEVAAAGVPVVVVGRGSNLLVADDGFRGVALRLGRYFRDHEPAGGGLRLGGAVYMPAAAKVAAHHGLTGMEFAAEIPGSFGGAVRMNAGAHGRCVADILMACELFDLRSGIVSEAQASELGFGYRRSSVGAGWVVTAGTVRLQTADPSLIAARNAAHIRWRRQNQPPGRSCGSVFKNPSGDSAGRLIEAAGAKGLERGGARVSDVHANFIVVRPGAAARDIWDLIGAVRDLVESRTGIRLELEVCLVGSFPAGQGED